MPDDLYERDILVWSEKQADLLRRLARGEGLNERVDWDHVIEEVEDVGLSELRGCESLLAQALVHLMKLRAEPDGQTAAHWISETIGFLTTAKRRFSPGMRQRIDLDDLYRAALRQVPMRVLTRWMTCSTPMPSPKCLWANSPNPGVSPSMRQRIDLDKLYRTAIRVVRTAGVPLAVPEECPYTFDELLNVDADVETLVARLG